MNLKIELRPHIGIQQTQLGPVEVEHDQYIIVASSSERPNWHVQVGYVGKHPGAPINFLRQHNGQPWPESVKQAVRDQIAEQLGAGTRKEGQPPEMLPDDDVGDEDDD